MITFDDVREFFGMERRHIHPLWVDFFSRVDASDGTRRAVEAIDPEALLIALMRGWVEGNSVGYSITAKGRKVMKRRPIRIQ